METKELSHVNLNVIRSLEKKDTRVGVEGKNTGMKRVMC